VYEGRALKGIFGVLKVIFGLRRGEVAVGWRRLHSEEFHNLYASPNIIKVIKSRMVGWAGHITGMGEMRNVYNILVGKYEGKKQLRRLRRQWEYNIRMDLKRDRLGKCGLDSCGSGNDQWRALLNTVMNFWVL
jgi:hypothetical protein